MSTLLGNTLRQNRLSKKLTLKDIEHITGINNAYLSQLETGRILKPRLAILNSIAPVYGIPLETLLQLSGQIVFEGEIEMPTGVPDFIVTASKCFSLDDWEAFRGIFQRFIEEKQRE